MKKDPFAEGWRTVQASVVGAFESLDRRGYVQIGANGAHPRMAFELTRPSPLVDAWRVSIDLTICLYAAGRRTQECSMASPFDLAGAASLERREDGQRVRYWRSLLLRECGPLEALLPTLAEDVLEIARVIESWTVEDLLANARRRVFPG